MIILLISSTSSPAAKPANKSTKQAVENDVEINIIQALDQPINLEVDEVPIREAFQELSKNTGFPIEIDPDVYSLLPYSSRTTLTATIEGQTLRESLIALLRPVGLTYEVISGKLVIKPTIHLARLVRRAIWAELDTLEMLYSQPWSDELFEKLRFQFQDSPAADSETHRETLKRLASAVGEGTAAEVLEHACDQYGWVWYPSDEYIAIVTKMRQIDRQLNKRVSFNYAQTNLSAALLDLQKRAGVLFRMDPGVLASLPPQATLRFSLSLDNATIRQALELIAGHTGLEYFVEPDGIRFTTSSFAPPTVPTVSTVSTPDNGTKTQGALAAALQNPIVGQITLNMEDGSSYAFFIRDKDLPPEVNELRKSKIRNTIDAIRKALMAEQQQD